jgi:transcriptional regulator with XRE-family HTH domain
MGDTLQRKLAAVAELLKGDGTEADMAAKTRLGAGSIHRIRKGQNVTLDTIEQFAKAYGFEAWELLFPGFDPAAPPGEQFNTLRNFYQDVTAAANAQADKGTRRGVDADRAAKGAEPQGVPRRRR